MANYSLNQTKFTPFTFDEMIKPLAMYGQEYRAQEEALAAISDKASKAAMIAETSGDPYVQNLYNNFAMDLESQAAQLMSQGLTPGSRKGMLDMRSRYGSEIVPIEDAFNRRRELSDKQLAAMAADPTLRYERYMKDVSLGDLIKNPSLDWGRSYSGALLTKQVSQTAGNLLRYTSKGNLKRLGLPYKWERDISKGVDPSAVHRAIMTAASEGDPEAVQWLRTIRNQVLSSSGVGEWAKGKTWDEFVDFANQGLYSAIGETKTETFTDDAGLAAYKQSISGSRGTGSGKGTTPKERFPLNPRSRFAYNPNYNKEVAYLRPSRAHVTKEGNAVGYQALKNVQDLAYSISPNSFSYNIGKDKYSIEGRKISEWGKDKPVFGTGPSLALQTRMKLEELVREGKDIPDSILKKIVDYSDNKEAARLYTSMIRNMGFNEANKWLNENVANAAGPNLGIGFDNMTQKAKEEAYNIIYKPEDDMTHNIASKEGIATADALANTEWNITLDDETAAQLHDKLLPGIMLRKELTVDSKGNLNTKAANISAEDFAEAKKDRRVREINAIRDPSTGNVYLYTNYTDKDGNQHQILVDQVNTTNEYRAKEALSNAYQAAVEYDEAAERGDYVDIVRKGDIYSAALEDMHRYMTNIAGVVKVKDYVQNYTDD